MTTSTVKLFNQAACGLWLLISLLASAPARAGEGRPRLMTVAFVGGLCPDGRECRSERTILADGTYVGSASRVSPRGGRRLSRREAAELARRVRKLDLKAVRASKFTDTCPSAYDGQEIVYTFYLEGREETLSACEFNIDAKAEPFATFWRLYKKWQ